MPGGRPPKPVELKRRTGNPGKRALPAPLSVVPAAASLPKPPRTLDRAGRTAWKRLWAAGAGWLSPATDIDIVTRLCELHDERADLQADIVEHGRVLVTDKGYRYTNPAVTQIRKVELLITKYEGLCGFTPSDRSRLGLAEVKRVSKLAEFLGA